MYRYPGGMAFPPKPLKRAVHILVECSLVNFVHQHLALCRLTFPQISKKKVLLQSEFYEVKLVKSAIS